MSNLGQSGKNEHKHILTISITCLIFFILDRIFKYLAIVGKISYRRNFGVAFSINIPEQLSYYYIAILLIILFFLLWQTAKAIKKGYWLLVTGYWLLLLGAISNLIDRLKLGYIIDYINFDFFYNNLADIMIGAGAIILITYQLWLKKKTPHFYN